MRGATAGGTGTAVQARRLWRRGGGGAAGSDRHGRRERGQATVEFALVIVALLAVILACLDFGAVVYDQVDLAYAARAGARAGALYGESPSVAVQAAEAAAQSAAGGLLRCPLGMDTADYGTENAGQVTVTLTCTYQPMTPLGALLASPGLPGTITLTATGLRTIEM
jgi:Flp pilus assembly protein TadG